MDCTFHNKTVRNFIKCLVVATAVFDMENLSHIKDIAC